MDTRGYCSGSWVVSESMVAVVSCRYTYHRIPSKYQQVNGSHDFDPAYLLPGDGNDGIDQARVPSDTVEVFGDLEYLSSAVG